jgi:alkanesulfonate monooxygenase SsuD/methylene tetrahydromethanopterin reductase-like flavin-dependent oxidoreductase (luciferase family)
VERSYWASIFFGGGVDFPATVRALEERGLTGVGVPQVYGPPFVPLAVAATVTKRIPACHRYRHRAHPQPF